jgi:hypothetical protein
MEKVFDKCVMKRLSQSDYIEMSNDVKMNSSFR